SLAFGRRHPCRCNLSTSRGLLLGLPSPPLPGRRRAAYTAVTALPARRVRCIPSLLEQRPQLSDLRRGDRVSLGAAARPRQHCAISVRLGRLPQPPQMFVADLERCCQMTEMNLWLLRKHHQHDVAWPQIAIARIVLAEQPVTDEHPVHTITVNHAAVSTEPSCPWLGIRDRQRARGIVHLHHVANRTR